MAEPAQLNTQAEILARAAEKTKLREQGIRAQAVKEGREKERAEILATVGAKTLDDLSMLKAIRDEHAKERIALDLHYKDAQKHLKAGSFWRGIGIMGVLTVLLCAGTGYGTFVFFVESQYATAAITQAATRPSAEAMRESMQRQEGGGFRP